MLKPKPISTVSSSSICNILLRDDIGTSSSSLNSHLFIFSSATSSIPTPLSMTSVSKKKSPLSWVTEMQMMMSSVYPPLDSVYLIAFATMWKSVSEKRFQSALTSISFYDWS